MNNEINFLKKWIIYLMVGWTLIVISFFIIDLIKGYKEIKKSILKTAELSVQKDIQFREWVASHGGIYVKMNKQTPPNPYLAYIKNRDIEITSKQHLTLMNPAYALSQLTKHYSFNNKYHVRLTSNILLNPNNAPDKWEKKALNIIENTKKPYYEFTKTSFRYITPFIVKKSCLKCHGFQGYRIGDVRGGISVTIPTKSLLTQYIKSNYLFIIELIILWLMGLILIKIVHKALLWNIKEKMRIYEDGIFALIDMMEKRDSYTAGHSKRVAEYSVLIAKEMGYDKDTLDLLYKAGMLHDIGKISTPDSILLKPGRLNKLEFEIIQEHVTTGYEILKSIEIYQDIAEIMKYHHEKHDGTGYPYGLKEDEIPILSAILEVADSFDAMTTSRIYKGRKELDIALKELGELAGTQFNPIVAKAAQKALKNLEIKDYNQLPHTKLEKERFAYFFKDQITEIYNQKYLELVLKKNSEFIYKYIMFIYMHNFSNFNKKYGWQNGNKELFRIAQQLQQLAGKDRLVFRHEGDDFIILSKDNILITQQDLNQIVVSSDLSISYKIAKLNNTIKEEILSSIS